MRARSFALALCLGLVVPLAGRAQPSVGVAAGVSAAVDPSRAAPSIDVTASYALADRWLLGAAVTGWTFSSAGTVDAGTEGALALAGGFRQRLSQRWSVLMFGGPAVAAIDRPAQSLEVRPALWLAPALEMSTRRPSLSLQLGARGLWFGEGLRLGAVAGLSYSFQ